MPLEWHTIQTYVSLAAPEPPDHDKGCLQFTITGEPGEWFCHVVWITKARVAEFGGKVPPTFVAECVYSLDDAKAACERYAAQWLQKASA